MSSLISRPSEHKSVSAVFGLGDRVARLQGDQDMVCCEYLPSSTIYARTSAFLWSLLPTALYQLRNNPRRLRVTLTNGLSEEIGALVESLYARI